MSGSKCNHCKLFIAEIEVILLFSDQQMQKLKFTNANDEYNVAIDKNNDLRTSEHVAILKECCIYNTYSTVTAIIYSRSVIIPFIA